MSNNNLKGFNSVFDSTLNNELQDNIIEFLDWNLLGKGNYFNVTKGETSHSNQDYSLLKLSSYPHYSAGQAWDGFRQNWVWQKRSQSTFWNDRSDCGRQPHVSRYIWRICR